MRHWTEHQIKCASCGNTVYVSREAIDEQREAYKEDKEASTWNDAELANELQFCLACAGIEDECDVRGEKDGMLHHPETYESTAEWMGKLILQARKEKAESPRLTDGMTVLQMAWYEANLIARHGRTPAIKEFFSAVAAGLGSGA